MAQVEVYITEQEMWDWLTFTGNVFDGRWVDVRVQGEGGRVWKEETERVNRYRDLSLSQMAEDQFVPEPLVRAVVAVPMALPLQK